MLRANVVTTLNTKHSISSSYLLLSNTVSRELYQLPYCQSSRIPPVSTAVGRDLLLPNDKMPNKYSHSVVLAHYSSIGLINLPNDQYVAYLKTYPSSKRTSIASRSQVYSIRTQGSITPSTGYTNRYRIVEDDAPLLRPSASRREQGGRARRNIVIASDEGSSDECIILHKKHGPAEVAPSQSQNKTQDHDLRTEKRRLPSVSTYTGRLSSDASEAVVNASTQEQKWEKEQEQASSGAEPELKRSSLSVINLNDFESLPAPRGADSASNEVVQPVFASSSAPKTNHISSLSVLANGRPASSLTQETRIYRRDPLEEPNFDDFPDKQRSEVTITAYNNTDPLSSPAVPRSQFSRPYSSKLPSPSSDVPAPLKKRLDSASDVNRDSTKLKPPRRNHSYDSISSMNSNDDGHIPTALPPVLPSKSQKLPRTKSAKVSPASRDPRLDEDVIDPDFFDTLKGGPHTSSTLATKQRFTNVRSNPNPSPSSSGPSRQPSRHSDDHTQQEPDFWRGLEEMLSDSDASVVFPPDIAKYKARDVEALPTLKSDKIPRNMNEDGALKRPSTAPGPKSTSRDAIASTAPLPEGRSRITVTKNGSSNKVKVAAPSNTVNLVDTSPPKKEKGGFLRKLRKKTPDERKP